MITMEPPTYSYARYIDWIIPYLTDTVLQASRTPNLHSSKMEMSLAATVKIILQQQLLQYEQLQNPNMQQEMQDQQI